MVWARIDDEILDNPKIARAGIFGFALHVAAIAWCCRNLTDGFVPYARVRCMLDFSGVDTDPANPAGVAGGDRSMGGQRGANEHEVAAHLCDVGLWDEVEDGYQINDFLVYNPSREKILAERARAKGKRDAKSPKAAPSRERRANVRGRSEDDLRTLLGRSDGPDPDPDPKEGETRVARETPPLVREEPEQAPPPPPDVPPSRAQLARGELREVPPPPIPMTLSDELTPQRRAMAEAIAAVTVPIDADAEWAQYRARRTHEGRCATDADWDGWLRRAVKFAARERLRDQERRDAPPKPYLVPATPPAPYHATSDAAEADRRRWAKDAGSAEERRAASSAAMAKLGIR